MVVRDLRRRRGGLTRAAAGLAAAAPAEPSAERESSRDHTSGAEGLEEDRGELGCAHRAHSTDRVSCKLRVLRSAATLCFLAALAGIVMLPDRAEASPHGPQAQRGFPIAPVSARLSQSGPDVVIVLRTRTGWMSRRLRAGRRLCVVLNSREACLTWSPGRRAIVLRRGPAGRELENADIARPTSRRLLLRFAWGALGLRTGRLRWRVESSWRREFPCRATGCRARLPARGLRVARLRRFLPSGCRARGAPYRTNGSRHARAIALTFDDGPSTYTPLVLRILERAHAHATFFLIGQQVRSGTRDIRRMLRDNDAIGDHTWSHPQLAHAPPVYSASQIHRAFVAIHAASGYRPCLFRAPYGAVSHALVSVAQSASLLTIEWDVDPRDWARPGVGAIVANVLRGARSGSIVVMHDGGGPRSETLAALPQIITGLRRRGYRLLTVPELLGLRTLYRYPH